MIVYIVLHYQFRIHMLLCPFIPNRIFSLLHCQREVYRRYEKGEREIPVWAAIKLAEYYDVSVDYLLGLSDNRRHFNQ